ncbi:DUF3226 domain-containing protein [Acinetobacter indicus]|uniref:DUF3226 domain-containing protein n=1 Tax=Acinetobacter indicus TaxID=756892 RepID=UPI001443D7F9|nr:DUF3226 domain-containing protein [Acinetobacter indicus]
MIHKIIVESFNDKAIFSHILENFCKSDTQIEPITNDLDWIDLDGLESTKLTNKLKDIKTDIIKAESIPKVGIIIDLDNSTIEERIEFLNSICSQAFELTVDIEKAGEFKTYTLPEYDLDFELAYCFSGLNGKGELEHLLKTIADTSKSHHANCLEQGWKSCLKSKGIEVKEKDLRKLWMDFYKRMDCLTPRERKKAKENVRWDNFLTLHPDKFDFSKDIKELNEIRSFLRQFCP